MLQCGREKIKLKHMKIENIVYLTSYKHIHTYKIWWDSFSFKLTKMGKDFSMDYYIIEIINIIEQARSKKDKKEDTCKSSFVV